MGAGRLVAEFNRRPVEMRSILDWAIVCNCPEASATGAAAAAIDAARRHLTKVALLTRVITTSQSPREIRAGLGTFATRIVRGGGWSQSAFSRGYQDNSAD